ncbi:MAG: hypothetical protein LBU23_10740, partial [Planctomycetota bacterium]|nr:hypothetical protein [Planctomycetota bacterium]
GGIVVAFALSWIYGPLDYYYPQVYLNLHLAAGMGHVIGTVAAAMLKRLRIDGRFAAMSVGGVSGLAALWFAWASYLWTASGYDWDFYTAFSSPAYLWDILSYLAANPLWTLGRAGRNSLSSGPPILYYAVWTGEFLFLVLYPPIICRRFVENHFLCGKCFHWLGETGDVAFFVEPDDMGGLAADLEAGNASPFPGLIRRRAGAEEPDSWLEIKGYACSRCQDEDSYVRVFRNELKLNKKAKKLELSGKPLSGFICVGVDLEQAIFMAPEADDGSTGVGVDLEQAISAAPGTDGGSAGEVEA